MSTTEHVKFHRDAAESADATARRLFAEAGYDADHPKYKAGLVFDKLVALHALAAAGTMAFDDCPSCQSLRVKP